MTLDTKQRDETLLAELANLMGADNVSVDATERAIFGMDIFFERCPPLAIVRPGTTDELADAVRATTQQGMTLAPRGGGLSYSGGYLTDRSDTIAIDTRRLNRIIEINAEDMFVVVEAGVTWQQLDDALAAEGLRTPFWGTGSGLHATVGGSLAQNAANYGSARYGTAAESVLGLSVVLANGTLLRTGSWANDQNPTPFDRTYGPDLTGLFLGDGGALAIKAAVSMRLIRRPKAVRHAAYGFDDRLDMVKAMAEVGRQGLASEVFAFDPFFLSERIASTGFADDVQKMIGVIRGETSVLAGMKEALKVAAAGRRHLEGVGYTLHMAMEGRDDVEADNLLGYTQSICESFAGKAIVASVPRVMRGTPFPPPYMLLGPEGDRWTPMHGIVPHSRHEPMLQVIDEYMDSRRSVIERHDLRWGQVSMLIGGNRVLIEVNFYFKDKRTPMIESYLEEDFLATKASHSVDTEARGAVEELRNGLAEEFHRVGGTHLQIGRTYPFLESRTAEARALLIALKDHLDPDGLMNPGSLGLG
jgi:glycolate oxidase